MRARSIATVAAFLLAAGAGAPAAGQDPLSPRLLTEDDVRAVLPALRHMTSHMEALATSARVPDASQDPLDVVAGILGEEPAFPPPGTTYAPECSVSLTEGTGSTTVVFRHAVAGAGDPAASPRARADAFLQAHGGRPLEPDPAFPGLWFAEPDDPLWLAEFAERGASPSFGGHEACLELAPSPLLLIRLVSMVGLIGEVGSHLAFLPGHIDAAEYEEILAALGSARREASEPGSLGQLAPLAADPDAFRATLANNVGVYRRLAPTLDPLLRLLG